MLDPHAPARKADDLHDIKAVNVAWPAVPLPPDFRDSADRLPLSPADRFPPSAVPGAPAGLDLHEGDQGPAADHQVDLIPADSETMGGDLPAICYEVSQGMLLAIVAEAMPRIAPSGDG
jgi:hypothetical protein